MDEKKKGRGMELAKKEILLASSSSAQVARRRAAAARAARKLCGLPDPRAPRGAHSEPNRRQRVEEPAVAPERAAIDLEAQARSRRHGQAPIGTEVNGLGEERVPML